MAEPGDVIVPKAPLFDTNTFANCITGRVPLGDKEPWIFKVLLFKNGSGLRIEISSPDGKIDLMPVILTTEQIINVAIETLKRATDEKIKEEENNKKVAG